MKALLVGVNAKYIHSSLALYSLQTACQSAGHDVETAEYTINQEILYVLNDIAGREPTVVGFACYIWNREMILKISSSLKKAVPEVIVILGGPEASGDATELLQKNQSVDFVVQGEGEESLPELLSRLSQGGNGNDVAGIAAWRDGRVELNGGVRLVENLDTLLFPYQVEAMAELTHRIVYYESSRGCPFSCSYCVSSTTHGVRYRSVEKVKAELRFFLQQGVKQVKFVDRTFNVDPKFYREIWQFIASEPGTTNFHFEIVADHLSQEDVQWLSKLPPGRFQFEIGVQSTDEATLIAVGRRNDWETLKKNVQALLSAGNIHLHLDLIAGLPHEGVQEFRRSFNSVYELKPDMLQIGFLKLLPGTRIRREAKEHGYVWVEHPPYEVLANDILTYGDIRQLKLMEEVFNQTYNSGRFYYSLLHLVTTFKEDAFEFYCELSQWWGRQRLAGKTHSPEGVLSQLLHFAEQFSPTQRLRLDELLKFDVLIDKSGAMRGEGLKWNREHWEKSKNALWRNEDTMNRYIPGYRFTNWRDVKRKYPIEVFHVNIPQWIISGEWTGEKLTPVLFDLTKQRPEWHVLSENVLFTEAET